MAKFKFNKLVRDKIVGNIKKSGDNPKYKILSDAEYIKELKRKLIEECNEIANSSKNNLPEEIADIQDIIDSIIYSFKISNKDIKRIQSQKRKKSGSFKKNIYIETVETKEDSEWNQYYRKNPAKYPEVKSSFFDY